jgi:hypothetical protein
LRTIIVPNNQLRVLHIKDCNNASPQAVADILSRSSNLQSLTISKMTLTPIALKAIGDGILAATRGQQGLSQNLLPSSGALNAVSANPNSLGSRSTSSSGITTLDISWCKVPNDSAIEGLFKALPALTSVDVNKTHIGDRGLNQIVSQCPLLEQVNLSSTKVSDEGVLNLLSSCGHSLRYLKLTSCWKVSDITMNKLAASTPALRYLNLGWVTKISYVRPIYAHCHSLNTLVLDGLGSLKDDIIFPLIQHPETLPNLSVLQINGCSDISSSAIFQLRMARPGCVIIHGQK